MRQFHRGDIEIKYRRDGVPGPVIVLVHGFGGGPGDWAEFSPAIAKNNRVIPLNIRSFFSCEIPCPFHKQVEILSELIEFICKDEKVDNVSLIGQSYGGTLCLALATICPSRINQLTLLNPMPFHPFEKVSNPHLKMFVGVSYIPGGISVLMKSPVGQRGLHEAAKVFSIGLHSGGEIKHFNKRKIDLLEKAIARFRWVDQNEDWNKWVLALSQFRAQFQTRVYFSNRDPLFAAKEFESVVNMIPDCLAEELQYDGHLLAQQKWKDLLVLLGFEKERKS